MAQQVQRPWGWRVAGAWGTALGPVWLNHRSKWESGQRGRGWGGMWGVCQASQGVGLLLCGRVTRGWTWTDLEFEVTTWLLYSVDDTARWLFPNYVYQSGGYFSYSSRLETMVICTRMKAVEAVRFWAYFAGDTNMACCLITYRLREKRQLCFTDRASPLQHFWHFGPDKFLLWKCSWCTVGCSARSLASVLWIDMPLSFPSNLW